MLFSSPIFYLIVVVTMSMIFGIEYFYAFTRFWVYPTMREYGLVLRKKKLVHDDRFFEKGLVASIKSIFNPIQNDKDKNRVSNILKYLQS